MTALFSIQNGVYNWSAFLNNNSLRGALAGLSAAPFYIFLESKKLYSRLGLTSKYKNSLGEYMSSSDSGFTRNFAVLSAMIESTIGIFRPPSDYDQ